MEQEDKHIVDMLHEADEYWFLANVKREYATSLIEHSVKLTEKANKLYTQAISYKKVKHPYKKVS